MTSFNRIIQRIRISAEVLDVGAWGLGGENTSYLIFNRFKNTVYMNHKQYKGVTLVGDFYTHKFKKKFDLIVLDLDIETNVTIDWSLKGLKRCRGLLKKGGILINYIMATADYGKTEKTHELIRTKWKEFWGTDDFESELVGKKLRNIPGYELFIHEQEKRRPEITWVALIKK